MPAPPDPQATQVLAVPRTLDCLHHFNRNHVSWFTRLYVCARAAGRTFVCAAVAAAAAAATCCSWADGPVPLATCARHPPGSAGAAPPCRPNPSPPSLTTPCLRPSSQERRQAVHPEPRRRQHAAGQAGGPNPQRYERSAPSGHVLPWAQGRSSAGQGSAVARCISPVHHLQQRTARPAAAASCALWPPPQFVCTPARPIPRLTRRRMHVARSRRPPSALALPHVPCLAGLPGLTISWWHAQLPTDLSLSRAGAHALQACQGSPSAGGTPSSPQTSASPVPVPTPCRPAWAHHQLVVLPVQRRKNHLPLPHHLPHRRLRVDAAPAGLARCSAQPKGPSRRPAPPSSAKAPRRAAMCRSS